jgi:hypothetical protein
LLKSWSRSSPRKSELGGASEGNRRLAAIRILQKPALAKGTGIAVPEISPANLKTLKEVTVYAVTNPDQAREYIGFKHINGPHKWDAIAKARFAADWYRKEHSSGLTIEKIARRLGDNHDTVVRLVKPKSPVCTTSRIVIQASGSRSPTSTPP